MLGWTRRRVGHGVELAFAQEHALHLLQVERARATTAEDRELVPALIHRPVTVYTSRHCQRRPIGLVARNQFGSEARAESIKIRRGLRREQLHPFETVLPIRHQRE